MTRPSRHHSRPRSRPGRGRDERGISLVLTSLMMTALLVFVAFGVDLTHAREVRRQAQTAADAAALAAVQSLPNEVLAIARELLESGGSSSTPDPVARARAYVASNGFDPDAASYHYPPASGNHAGDDDCFEVVVRENITTIFGGVANTANIDIETRAVACAETIPASGAPALFAGSETCGGKTFKFSGSGTVVDGGIHSNDDMDIPGSVNTFLPGAATHTGSISVGGSGNTFEPGSPGTSGVKPWPVTFDYLEYRPGGSRANQAIADGQYYNAGSNKIDMGWLQSNAGYNSVTKRLRPGLYVTTGDIDLSDSGLWVGLPSGTQGPGVTFVAGGQIKISGSNHVLTPWDPERLLAFSNYRKASPLSDASNCDSGAIDMSGSTNAWSGYVYAPRGSAKFAGSSNTTLSGSVIAYALEVSGSTMGFTAIKDGLQVQLLDMGLSE